MAGPSQINAPSAGGVAPSSIHATPLPPEVTAIIKAVATEFRVDPAQILAPNRDVENARSKAIRELYNLRNDDGSPVYRIEDLAAFFGITRQAIGTRRAADPGYKARYNKR